MPDAGPSPRPRPAPASRRAALGLLAVVLAAPRRAHTQNQAQADNQLSDAPSILVAGPTDGRLDRVGHALAATLKPALPAGATVALTRAGGDDGVTGANQFTARVTPDGNTLLLVPGDTALAWQVGDPRAKFDPARWLGVVAGVNPAVVLVRGVEALKRGQALRVAMSGPVGPDLAAMLGLELAGFATAPVFGANLGTAGGPSLAAGAIDAVLVRGAAAPGGLAPLVAQGFSPLFALGGAEPGGRDPSLPQLPGLIELAAAARTTAMPDALLAAWRGLAAATQTSFALVLPQLAPAARVALWRQAAPHAVAAPALHLAAPSAHLVGAPEAHALVHALAPEPAALAALRAWMGARLNWAPG